MPGREGELDSPGARDVRLRPGGAPRRCHRGPRKHEAPPTDTHAVQRRGPGAHLPPRLLPDGERECQKGSS